MMTSRALARIGATGLFAAAAFGLAPTPAYAAGADFGITLTGTTLAAGANVKLSTVTLTNRGTTKPDVVDVVIDAARLDRSKVAAATLPDGCRSVGDTAVCRLQPNEIPAPGTSTKDVIALTRAPGATGDAGSLTVSVVADGDTDDSNDSATAKVRIGDSGADLLVIAQDVTAVTGDGGYTGRPVAPGAVGSLAVFIANLGDMTAEGVRVHISVPRHSGVAEDIDGCERSTDLRSLDCEIDADLVPLEQEPGEDAYLLMAVPVRVAPDATGPVSLTGGVVTTVAMDSKPYVAGRTESGSVLPRHFSRPTPAEIAALDADPTDNTDGFAVRVAGPASGTGGGQTDGIPAGGGQGDDGQGDGAQAGGAEAGGSLPVTGPGVLGFGGAGFAVVAVGVGLFVAARRRRVVLTIPGDER